MYIFYYIFLKSFTSPQLCFLNFLVYSGAPAGAFGARGRSTIAVEIDNPSSRENLDVTSVCLSVRTYVRTHGLGLGTSLSLSLIWSPSLANSNTKTFFGLSRVKTLCHFRLFFLAFSYDLDITLQLKRSDWMKRR